MSAPPFEVLFTREAQTILDALSKPAHRAKNSKVRKALRLRDVGPSHPGLNSHKYRSLTGPNGEDVWESYVENRTPSAWRIWWVYGAQSGRDHYRHRRPTPLNRTDPALARAAQPGAGAQEAQR